jgi:hypothetical protein
MSNQPCKPISTYIDLFQSHIHLISTSIDLKSTSINLISTCINLVATSIDRGLTPGGQQKEGCGWRERSAILGISVCGYVDFGLLCA